MMNTDFIYNKTCSLFSQPYLDTYNQCYKNIVTINLLPKGPLIKFIRKIKLSPLSTFSQPSPCNTYKQYAYAILSINGGCNSGNLMTVDEVPDLISYLVSNGYTVDTSITKMFNQSDIQFQTNNSNKLICFITYNN